jgi:NAD(P)-dependent dehydrogenase (short-subunit alcohol dehydrogenase family)
MKAVVIAGSTRGIGFGLAEGFLRKGCRVVVSGRTADGVMDAVRRLTHLPVGEVLGVPCDVTDAGQVQSLWDEAVKRFGAVDIWVNNAGVAHAPLRMSQLTPQQIREVIETNLIGAMNGARVAMRGFESQGYGALYNMEGLGSDGRNVKGMALYGATKYGLHYLTVSLAREVRGTGVIVAALRPGMVLTDLLMRPFDGRPQEWERARKVFNLLAERVDIVAPFLVERMLSNRKNGVIIKYLTPARLLLRLVGSVFRPRTLFP